MSTFTLTIELSNAGMEARGDVAIALRLAADHIDEERELPAADLEPERLRDGNGNTVGGYSVTE